MAKTLKRHWHRHWPLILGLVGVLYFIVTWGIGWIPGMIGSITVENSLALVAGVILLVYGNIKKH